MFRKFAILAALAGLCPAQGPDVLIPSGSLDGTYLLVDRDKDGKYTTEGEAWDFILDGVNTSPQNFMVVGNQVFWVDTILDQILWATDTNNNGIIEATERHVFFDALAAWTASEPNFLALDGNGWLWWTNDSGTNEGLYRSKDLNSDGDAEDAGETVAVLVEPATVTVANTPNSTSRTMTVVDLDSLLYDPTWGKGRFILEDEYNDQSIAFEDLNSDGDFNDTGEVYLFCALYNGGRLVGDVNPDVAAAKLPDSNEIYQHLVDPVNKVYYLLSADTTATQLDACIIFRGVDKNLDGDINDAGEVTVFWDGSLDSLGANKGYNFVYSMGLYGGKLYACAEWDAATDTEHLVLLEDKNLDGDADDAGELTVLWELPGDKTHYVPCLLPPGTFGVPKGKPSFYAYYGSATCATSLSATSFHNVQVGSTNWDDKPVIGYAGFHMRTWGCAAAAPGLFFVGVTKIPGGIPFDAGATCNGYISYDLGVLPFLTDAAGAYNAPLPLPLDPNLVGVWTYWQSAVLDATAPAGLGFTVSDAAEMKLGDFSYSIN